MKFDETLAVNARDYRKRPKATVHHTGKLGFNRDAEAYMNLSADSRLQLFRSAEAGNYFVAVLPAEADGGAAFKVKQTSGYYCANLKHFSMQNRYRTPARTGLLFLTLLSAKKRSRDIRSMSLNSAW